MQQTPLWVVITGIFLGPAVTAALLTYLFNRSLSRQKANLDAAVQHILNEQKASLDLVVGRELAVHETELKYAYERRTKRDEYIIKQHQALRDSYILVFEDGAQASPKKLLELLRRADAGVMEPFRATAGAKLIRTETERDIYEVHSFLWQAFPDGKPPSSRTVQRLMERKDEYVNLCWKAMRALEREVQTREQEWGKSDG
jgi:hypothetical protein